LQGCRHCLGLGTTRLGHVGTTAALATHLLGDQIDQLTGLDLAGQVVGDARDQVDLALATGQPD